MTNTDPLGPGICRGATHHGTVHITEVNHTHIGCTFGPDLRVTTTCTGGTWRPPAWDQHPNAAPEPLVIPWRDERQDMIDRMFAGQRAAQHHAYRSVGLVPEARASQFHTDGPSA
jgi:hypothetical protein